MDCSSSKRPPAPRWIKAWVPQSLVASGGKCSLLKWIREDTLKALKEKDLEPEETKPESITEVLFLCSYEGCGKTFIDAAALRNHVDTHGERKFAQTHGERKLAQTHGESKLAHNHGERKFAHNHGERQHVCHYEGCGKRFTDSSKLKRHFLIHTGERDFKCSFEGCGKAFALVFNLRTHMKTHYPENYHVCSYPECGKRFTLESKLKSHIKAHQEKNMAVKDTPRANKFNNASKTHSAANYRSHSVARPYTCPQEGCSKAYIHEYKLNLHLRNRHAGNDSKSSLATTNHAVAQAIDRDAHRANLKRSNPMMTRMMPPPNLPNRMGSSFNAVNKLPNRMGSSFNTVNKQWPADEMYEDDNNGYYENAEVGRWRYSVGNEDDDEGTEDEDFLFISKKEKLCSSEENSEV